MSKTPNYDKKVKAILDSTELGPRVCRISGKTWDFDEAELARCRKWNVPPSKLEPFMRMKFLGSWGAGVDLFWKKHFVTGKPILTASHPDGPSPVVTDREFYERDWGEENPKDYDPGRPFFDQMLDLIKSVPVAAFNSNASENCVGGGYAESVNTFMLFGTWAAKDSWYVFRNKEVDRMTDSVANEKSENSFSCCMALGINKCIQVFDSVDCLNCSFLFDCINCEDCFLSSNLRRRRYVFKNEQLSEEEYKKRIAEIDLSCTSTFNEWREKFRKLMVEDTVIPEHNNINAQNCNGEYLMDCLNSSGYFLTGTKDVHEGWFDFDVENCDFLMIGNKSQDCYYTCVVGDAQDIKFSFVTLGSRSCEFSVNLENCEYCFGCVGLKRERYYIFNKKYSEEEYWKKVDEIKCAMLDRGEYGDFMPTRLSNWPPQMSFASIAAPLTQEELDKLETPHYGPVEGMRFAPYPKDVEMKNVDEVPDCIRDVGDEWAGVPFFDEEEQRRFNVSPQELKYRKEKGYPFPRKHYRGRLIELFRQINSPEREMVRCAKCDKEIEVSKNHMFPDRTVYCHEDHLKYLDEKN